MNPRYVSLDTETTGLDADNDEVIEVAAIAFGLDGIEGEFQSFVKPHKAVPFQVERLTGIQASSLEKAPRFAAIAQELAEFIGDSPVIGQNIAFDLNFIGRGGVWPTGPAYDTFDLAQLLLPGQSDFSLRGIAERLEIHFPERHRARADADATRSVFLALRARLSEQPTWLLHEVQRLARSADWAVHHLCTELIAERPAIPEISAGLTHELLAPVDEIARPLTAAREAVVGDAEVVALLRRATNLESFGGAFESRPEQETMAVAVTRSLGEGRHLIVEAGTGTGKSLAYLLPAALQAIRRNQRVVVSTDTIGLQEQLIDKDLPVVKALAAATETEPLRVAALKGRRNYVCLQRWTAARHTMPASKEEAQLMARMLVWLQTTQTGDRAELNLHSTYDAAWSRLSSENTACLQTQCPFVKNGTCFVTRARKRAESAHILVVNHALLLSDMATGGHVLPAYDHLIIDEAHNLEDEATSRFAFRASETNLTEYLDRIGRRGDRPGGIAGSITDAMRGSDSILGPGSYLAGVVAALVTAATRARTRASEPFRLLNRVLRECAPDDNNSGEGRMLITRSTRVQPLFSDLQIAAENLDAALVDLLALLDSVSEMVENSPTPLIDQDTLASELSDLRQIGGTLQYGLSHAILEDDKGLISWLERSRQTGEVAVCSAPLEVADILRHDLFAAKESVVLTSATMSTEGSFDFVRSRIGLDDAEELMLGSPFDFPNSTLITIPTGLPDPNESSFVQATGELLIEAIRASGGRTLALFTSYGSLHAAYDVIKAPLEAEGILVLGHGVDGSPRQMLNALRENPRTVLMGTSSFWEGVDVVGDALSLLIINRLPFAVPTDPIYQARSALYDEPFDQYAVPNAVLRFRQGFGRLIRSKTDRGVMLVLDRRIRGRRYGEVFLRSLPRCSLRDLPVRDIPGAIEEWLA